MQGQSTVGDYTGQEFHVGIDVGLKSWKVTVLGATIEKTITQPPSAAVLLSYLRKTYPGGRYHCAYEAGYFGFEYQRQLSQDDCDCIVVNPADIPMSNRDRVYKTDNVDARRIAREHSKGDLMSIWVPPADVLEDRSLVRLRHQTSTKQTRVQNQIKGMLRFHCIEISPVGGSAHWSKAFLTWLDGISFGTPSGRQALDVLMLELRMHRQLLLQLTRQIRQLSRSPRYTRSVELLVSIPGISAYGAMVLMTELVDISRFRNLDHLAGYIGFVPATHSSGERDRTTGITPRSKGWLRALLVESTWIAVRHDPQLQALFENLSARMPKSKAIISVTRRLLSRIRHVLKTDLMYERRPLEASNSEASTSDTVETTAVAHQGGI